MNDKNKSNHAKTQKNIYTQKLFNISNDEDFFKSSSNDLSDSVSFKKEIKPKTKNSNKKLKENNILKNNIKQKLYLKKLNDSSEVSSSYKKSDEDEKIAHNNKEFIFNKNNLENEENNNVNSEIISKSDILSSNSSIENKKNNNINDKKNTKDILINDGDNFYLKNKTNKKRETKKKNYNRNNIKNNVSSSVCDSRSYLNKEERERAEREKEREKNNYIESSINLNNNDQQEFIKLKPLKLTPIIQNGNKINDNDSFTYKPKKKTSFKKIKYTSKESKETEPKRRSKRSSLTTRKIIKKVSREFSVKSSNSSNNNEVNKKSNNKIKIFMEKNLLNFPFLIIMCIINFYTLVSNDIKHIWLDKSVDIYFDIINLILLFYFITEIIIFSLFDEVYIKTLVFWVDIIGTIFIILNVESITDYIFGYNNFSQNSSNKTKILFEYFSIFIIMFERLLRSIKILKCLKLYNLIIIKNKFKNILSEKQHIDLVKKEMQKQKLIEKIKNIEDPQNIDESLFSNESIHQMRTVTFNVNEKKIEKIEKNIRNDRMVESPNIKKFTNGALIDSKISQKEDTKDNERNNIKRSLTTRKINKINLKRESLKTMRKNRINKRNNTEKTEQSKKINCEEDDKKGEEINKEIEEEIIRKIDEKFKNTTITNKVKISMRKKVIIFFIIILFVSVIFHEHIISNYKNKEKILFYSFIIDSILNSPYNNTYININRIKSLLLSNKGNDFPIINITKNDILLYENIDLSKNSYRYCELAKISSNENYKETNEIINIIYSIKKENNIKHILFLIITILLIILLVLTTFLTGIDVNRILLSPLEVMIEIADGVSKDPMKAKHIEELENQVMALLRKNTHEDNNKSDDNIKQNFNECYNTYEVKVIMNAIIKISALLAMSLGEAGGEIIHKNLSSSHSLYLRSRGKKKSAIFGFCNIRNFEQINLVLQEKTIPLINQIAEIVHSSVDKFRGNTNKNIGDSFFNVWKFYNNVNVSNKQDKKIIKDNLLEMDPLNPQINITADCAVLAYLRCILKINKNLNILGYNHNPKLNHLIPNFKISMGFGLHLGYGIEGPIGSLFKMEASYLSPNVNIAARLETATKQFGVSLLISGKLYNLFTEEMKEICRYVDCVRVKGSTEPIDLYTIDINYNVTPQDRSKLNIIKTVEEKAKIFKEKKLIVEGLIEEYGSIAPIILEKNSYLELIDEKSEVFYEAWDNAIKSYKKGNWEVARQYFEECLREDSNDGPANTLYNYIKKFDFKSPKNWKGERELTNK